MNKQKKIKKILRNKENIVLINVVETDCWSGSSVISEVKTYGNLIKVVEDWNNKMIQDFGPSVNCMMDVPTLSFEFCIYNKEDNKIYSEIFHREEDIREFLINNI